MDTHKTVRDAYAAVAVRETTGPCCGLDAHARSLGYSQEELDRVPEGANLGLGCGNPTAGLALSSDAVVLDLGSGAGMDAFVVARELGTQGRVIGVDMTPEMNARARQNAAAVGLEERVEFREGRIESLPVEDGEVDVVISNCVINLSPDKPKVFAEAFRVLRSGGTLSVSDIVLSEALLPEVVGPAEFFVACVSGASLAEDYLAAVRSAGFVDVDVQRQSARPMFESMVTDPLVVDAVAKLPPDVIDRALDSVWSYKIRARKP